MTMDKLNKQGSMRDLKQMVNRLLEKSEELKNYEQVRIDF
jgi:hypothetical protein